MKVLFPTGDIVHPRVGPRADLMNGFGRKQLTATPSSSFRFPRGAARVGIISNPRSRRNWTVDLERKIGPGVLAAAPTTNEQLVKTLRSFAEQELELLVIDGGDGTVRDVLSAAAGIYSDDLPPLALLPSGKTNALALDLGIPVGWSLQDAMAAHAAGRIQTRSPIEIRRDAQEPLCGFIFGVGGFVMATELAQSTHRFGAIDGLAVGLSLVGAVAQTCFGSLANRWRAGERVEIYDYETGETKVRNLYLLLASTLQRMPLGTKPLGKTTAGLDVLAAEAPPRLLPIAAAAIVAGQEGGWLQRHGYHHAHDIPPVQLKLEGGFILDGEMFPGGTIDVRTGAPIRFVTP
ncbi:diacylglycerol/lipid kinase family protein [Sphingomonas mucosissima]|uniref:Lipid kinase YegS n=1 Tax=Sphingomonas mucosissima TaxID=370959 RepID=A0A245ZIJ8_9SPHN|nr:acylglycerol kinase family protein [Sphingomonas mucosissima]OWK29569.1 lipid kinase YegS [Sphingomonas mucosissima]